MNTLTFVSRDGQSQAATVDGKGVYILFAKRGSQFLMTKLPNFARGLSAFARHLPSNRKFQPCKTLGLLFIDVYFGTILRDKQPCNQTLFGKRHDSEHMYKVKSVFWASDRQDQVDREFSGLD